MTDAPENTDETIFTEAHAKWLMKRGACKSALNYVGMTCLDAAKARPWAALRFAPDRLTDAQFAAAAKAEPGAALDFAPDRYRKLIAA